MSTIHQYIVRSSGAVCTEHLIADRLVNLLYDPLRERSDSLFRALTGPVSSRLLAIFNFDLALGARLKTRTEFFRTFGVNVDECLDPPSSLDTPRKIFERRIRYWDCRPLPTEPGTIVSPADARILTGSLSESGHLFIKDKFFDLEELLGGNPAWQSAFHDGDYAVFRLTPDKYHYNHMPVTGRVLDIFEVDGTFHSCNPAAVVTVATPYSKNKRTVTIIDTDVPGGTGAGLVAMVEVVALMIGEIVQCYSKSRYDNPQPVSAGMFVRKGQPKSLYRPGSSTDVLLFQKGRVRFSADLVSNQARRDVTSRFTIGFESPLVETDIQVRSAIAKPCRPLKGGQR